jgi:eukaryotic-like serine/threonine-protein kinase
MPAISLIQQRYRLDRVLAEHGPARTYLAQDTVSGERCVLKCLNLAQADVGCAESWQRQAQVLAHLAHAGIPALRDTFTEGNGEQARFCLVLEYLESTDLATLLASGKRFTEREALRLLRGLAKILRYLQSFSPPLLHRNLVPANILIGQSGQIYLSGFSQVRNPARGKRSVAACNAGK